MVVEWMGSQSAHSFPLLASGINMITIDDTSNLCCPYRQTCELHRQLSLATISTPTLLSTRSTGNWFLLMVPTDWSY